MRYSGAYVVQWGTRRFERMRLNENAGEEETRGMTLKERLFQPRLIGGWMGLIALLTFLFALGTAELLNWIFGQ